MSNRFRTGMTIAMFSLIVFSLTVFSILIANFTALEGGEESRGNVDVVADRTDASNVNNVVEELRTWNAVEAGRVARAGSLTLGAYGQEVRMSAAVEWMSYPVIAADDAFLGHLEPALDSRAYGYGSDAEALDAVRNDPSLALIDLYGSGQGFSDYDFTASIEIKDGYFQPVQVLVRNGETGETRIVSVVGVLRLGLESSLVAGIYVNEDAYTAIYGAPRYQRDYLRLVEGTDASAFADTIESALAVRGVAAVSVAAELDRMSAQTTAFNRMFQAFVALGLVVGIAGLGVIAFRSVVERRQQIGMLRAIGFQRGTVALTFLVESSFIAVMGILSGVVCGTILARNLLTSGSFTEGATGDFTLPWAEVSGLAVASLVVSLLMTWWPSRGAARVPVADALRYE
jgi:putative ABC transport system permease protein